MHSLFYPVIFLLAAVSLSLLAGFNQVKAMGLGWQEEHYLPQLEAAANGAGYGEEGEGPLSAVVAVGMEHAAEAMGLPRPAGLAMVALRVAQNLGVLLLIYPYCRALGLRPYVILLGWMAVAWAMTNAAWNTRLAFDVYTECMLCLAAAWCMVATGGPRYSKASLGAPQYSAALEPEATKADQPDESSGGNEGRALTRDAKATEYRGAPGRGIGAISWTVPLAFLAALNRETGWVVPLLVFAAAVGLGPQGGLSTTRRFVAPMVCALAYAAGAMAMWSGYRPEVQGNTLLLANIESGRAWGQLAITFGVLPFLAVWGWPRTPLVVQCITALVLPVVFIWHFTHSPVAATHVFMMPLVVCVLPAALVGVQGFGRDGRDIRDGRDNN